MSGQDPTQYRGLVVCLVAAIVLATVAGTAVASGVDVRSQVDSGTATDGPVNASTNNSTVRHVDPSRVNDGGDLGETRSWFERRIAGQLEASSIEVSQGRYEQAQSLVDDDVEELLGRYVDVAGETGGDGDAGDDEGRVDRLQRASERQEEYVEGASRYERTYQEYVAARERGDEDRARALARRLERIAANLTATGGNLTEDYTRISNSTGSDLGNASRSVDEFVENVTARQTTVREATFAPTRLSVQTDGGPTSFASPIRIDGQLVRRDGEPIDAETVTIAVGERTYDVDLTENGSYSLQYRPILHPAPSDGLAVAYRPRPASPYLGSNATVEASVRAIEPDVSVAVNRTTLRFGDRFTVSGRVSAANESVPGLPMVVALGPSEIGTVRTSASGRFVVSGRLPADVDVGDRQLAARVGVADRAIGPGRSATEVTIRARSTALTVETSGPRRASGRLATAAGRPVPDGRIDLRIDGERVGTARTDRDGEFVTTIDVPGETDGEAALLAAFEGSGTNLAPTTASTSVVLPGAGGLPLLPLAGIVTLLGIAGAGFALSRRRSTADSGESATARKESAPGAGEDASGPSAAEQLLTAAREAHRSGDAERAVSLAYTAVRTTHDGDPADTHWEFYRSRTPILGDQEGAALQRLTRAYERAVFAGAGDAATADDALADAESLT